MSQAAQMKATPEVASAVKMAEEFFELQYAGIEDPPEIEGDTASFRGSNFNYELIEMYRDPGKLERKGEYACSIPNAGDEGDTNEITVESIKLEDGSTMFVVYDVFQPTHHNDEDWVCSGSLSLTLTTPETHEALLAEKVDALKRSSEAMAVSLAQSLIDSVADDADAKARIISGLCEELTRSVGFAYDRNQDRLVPVGPQPVWHALEKVGRTVSDSVSQAWAGAMLGNLLVEHPLVESFLVEFSTSEEYDDNSHYTAKHAAITSVVFRNNVPSVKLEDDGDVEVDAPGYAARMQDDIEHVEWDLYDGFAEDPDDEDEFMIQVRRSDLTTLLEGDVIDGAPVGKEIRRTWECVR